MGETLDLVYQVERLLLIPGDRTSPFAEKADNVEEPLVNLIGGCRSTLLGETMNDLVSVRTPEDNAEKQLVLHGFSVIIAFAISNPESEYRSAASLSGWLAEKASRQAL